MYAWCRHGEGNNITICVTIDGFLKTLMTRFSFQESHLYNIWAFINKLVRVDQEEQVPGVLAAARQEVRAQPPAVSRHSV